MRCGYWRWQVALVGPGTLACECLRADPRRRRAAFENGRELTGDGKRQRHAGLGFLDPEGERVHVDALPAERQYLVPAHAGVEPEAEGFARRWVGPGADRREEGLAWSGV